MFGIRLLNRSAIASTSTVFACTSNAARCTSQRYFSLSRAVNDDKPYSASSTESQRMGESAKESWKRVAQLSESTSKEYINQERNAQLWRAVVRSVAVPSSDSPRSAYDLAQAAKKRSEDEELEHQWQNRPRYGPDRPAVPSDGRSVAVKTNDFARAMSNLNSIFKVNNIRTELRLGERYEKPNQKRRRLKSERHRRRFAHMVREKVQLIMHLKSRGA